MWTANIDTIEKSESSAKIQITYTGPTGDIVRESYNMDSPQILKQTIKNKLNQLNNRDIFVSNTLLGPPDLTEPPPTPPPVKTAREIFMEDWARFQILQKLVNLQIIEPTSTNFVNLRNKIKTDLKPEYIGSM